MENDLKSSIEAAIVKLSEQAKASSNDHIKAQGFAAAVKDLADARLLIDAVKPAEPAKKSN